VNQELRKALAQVHAEAEALGINAVLVGALIMEFTTEFKEGYPAYRRTNDAEHIRYWLENYAAMSDTDTRGMDFALARGWKEMGAEFSGAALLGHEVGKLASPAASDRIKRFLKESSDANSPFVDALLREGQGYLGEEDVAGPVEDIRTRLRAFQRGF